MRVLLVFAVCVLIGFSACNKASVGSKAPQITYISVFPREFKNGAADSSFSVTFDFFDEDADLGNANGTGANVFIGKTSYTDSASTSLPPIPDEFRDPDKGLKGTATVVFPTAPFVLDTLHQNGDSFQIELYVTDNAGNPSNKITTDYIHIKP